MSLCCKSSDLVCDLRVYACLCVHVCIYMSLLLYVGECLNCVCARTCTCVCVCVCVCVCGSSSSPHAVPDRLRLRVNRISLQEYDRLQYDKERLRDICKDRFSLNHKILTVATFQLICFTKVFRSVVVVCLFRKVCLIGDGNTFFQVCSECSEHLTHMRRRRRCFFGF